MIKHPRSRFADLDSPVSVAIRINLAFCRRMLPFRNSVQTYASNLHVARDSKSLKNRANQCKPMLQILQTYG